VLLLAAAVIVIVIVIIVSSSIRADRSYLWYLPRGIVRIFGELISWRETETQNLGVASSSTNRQCEEITNEFVDGQTCVGFAWASQLFFMSEVGTCTILLTHHGIGIGIGIVYLRWLIIKAYYYRQRISSP
jgi:hypothetical protein